MGFEDALDRLPEEPLTPRDKLLATSSSRQAPRDKLLAALEMYEEGGAMQRLALQRQHPDLDPGECQDSCRFARY
jgi:hypothetical protein